MPPKCLKPGLAIMGSENTYIKIVNAVQTCSYTIIFFMDMNIPVVQVNYLSEYTYFCILEKCRLINYHKNGEHELIIPMVKLLSKGMFYHVSLNCVFFCILHHRYLISKNRLNRI